MKSAEKIIDALTQLLEGYNELQASVQEEYGADDADDEEGEDSDLSEEVDAAIVTELRASLEAVIDAEDFSTEEIAAALCSLTEALEEIDPDVFESEDDEEEEEEDLDDEDVEIYDEDDLYDDEDFEEDEEEEDDEDEEDEDEEEDDDDEEYEDDDDY